MSFILDALKKSETERQRQSGPTVFEVKTALPRNRLPSWALGLIALLAVNLLVVAWLVLRGKPETGADQTASSSAANVQPQMSAPAASAALAPMPASASSAAVSSSPPQPSVLPAPQTAAAFTVAPNSEPASPPGAAASTEELNPQDYAPAVPPSAAGAASSQAGGAANVSSTTPRGSETHVTQGATSTAGVPLYEEVTRRGTNLPELRIDFHLYSPQPASRFVFLNMNKLREGESLPNGVRVETITAEGAVLSHRGTRFLLLKE